MTPHDPAGGFGRRYLLGLVCVAVLIIANQLVVQPSLARLTFDAPVMNIAGRQRMLSQKLTKAALGIEAARTPEELAARRQELSAAVAAWTRSHTALQKGDPSISVPASFSKPISEALAGLDEDFVPMRDAAIRIEQLLGSGTSNLPRGEAAVRAQVARIVAHESDFLERMETVVGMFESESSARVAALRRTGWIIMAGILLVLMALGCGVLVPAVRVIQRQFRELSRNEQRYRLLVQGMSDGLAIQNRSGVFQFVNDRLCEMMGYRREELIGRSIFNFVDSGSQAMLSEKMAASWTRSRSLPDVAWTTHEGEKLFTLVSLSPVPDHDGPSSDVYSVITDITERKRAEDALRSAHSELERRVEERTRQLVEANRTLEREMAERRLAEERTRQLGEQLAHASRLNTLGEMATELAHEINQPLGAIANYAEGCLALLESADATESADEMRAADCAALPGTPLKRAEIHTALERISAAALRAGEILRRVRGFVRFEHQQARVDLCGLISDVEQLCRAEAERCGMTVELQLADDLPDVWADPIQIQQVLVNLIRNGFQAMRCTPERRLLVRTRRNDRQEVEVSVADSGEGFAAGDPERIFEPFYTTRPEGLGMGLAISRSIVENHGGRLWAEANSGGGATLRFTLPGGGGNAG